MVWGSGLLYLSADAFPDRPLRWTRPLRFVAATAAWFLVAPLLAPAAVVIASSVIGGAPLVGWAAFRYLRWGGDEFVLLLTCGEPDAHAKARELKAMFLRERQSLALPPYVALSIGVAGLRGEADSLADAIRTADAEMYRDKLSTTGS